MWNFWCRILRGESERSERSSLRRLLVCWLHTLALLSIRRGEADATAGHRVYQSQMIRSARVALLLTEKNPSCEQSQTREHRGESKLIPLWKVVCRFPVGERRKQLLFSKEMTLGRGQVCAATSLCPVDSGSLTSNIVTWLSWVLHPSFIHLLQPNWSMFTMIKSAPTPEGWV